MTTFTSTGYSRVPDWQTMAYSDYRPTVLQVIRQDSDPSFAYSYSSVDVDGLSPKFATLFDP